MWYLILALLFGQPVPTSSTDQSGETTVQDKGHHGGETETPRPPRPKNK